MNAEILSKNEAVEYLRTGNLPDNFRGRLANFIEFYECSNCGGKEDMNAVFRCWFEEYPSWCPDCIELDNQGNKI